MFVRLTRGAIVARPLLRGNLLLQRQAQRGIAINYKDFRPTEGFQAYSEELENEIRKRFERLPPSGKIYQSPDGTARNPTDEELQEVAALTHLANVKRMTFKDYLRLSNEQMGIFRENQDDLSEYLSTGQRILDKIPVEDKETGEIQWQIIREKQKEGWEPLVYYGYIPAALLCAFFALFLDRENISDWALEELRLRAQERYNDGREELVNDGAVDAEELKKRDALIVERIISGEYDKLAGLKKAGSELPSSLI
ncbi:hypothetical protein TRVA0_004S04478 [Trichomonascus vanleenenianus]|uniref:uncharacterized protein n=1 Tax=Trichomonascus vanleenenianus TaxID=2268995 RepID=UPI003ECB88BB